jgi:hypothetical protein
MNDKKMSTVSSPLAAQNEPLNSMYDKSSLPIREQKKDNDSK